MGKPTAPGTQAWTAIRYAPELSANTDSPPGPAMPEPLERSGLGEVSLQGPSGPPQVTTPTAYFAPPQLFPEKKRK